MQILAGQQAPESPVFQINSTQTNLFCEHKKSA